MRGIETIMAEGRKAPAKRLLPHRYLLRWGSDGEVHNELVNRNDVVKAILSLKEGGVTSIEAFIDAKLEIGITVKLEGIE